MNLKEAFRYQNKLQSFMDQALEILNNDSNVTKVENTYLRHKVMTEAEDETVLNVPDTEYSDRITELARFLLGLLARVGIYPDQTAFHMGLRLAAHFGVFFIDGLLAAAALAVSLPRAERRAWPYIMAALACSALAVVAEVGKLYVPGRHLQWDETLLNVAGSVLGVGLVVAVSALRRRQG